LLSTIAYGETLVKRNQDAAASIYAYPIGGGVGFPSLSLWEKIRVRDSAKLAPAAHLCPLPAGEGARHQGCGSMDLLQADNQGKSRKTRQNVCTLVAKVKVASQIVIFLLTQSRG
jgi:hypothetical protein